METVRHNVKQNSGITTRSMEEKGHKEKNKYRKHYDIWKTIRHKVKQNARTTTRNLQT